MTEINSALIIEGLIALARICLGAYAIKIGGPIVHHFLDNQTGPIFPRRTEQERQMDTERREGIGAIN